MINSLDSRQSVLIKAMRFPLIVLVVFAHSLGFGNVAVSASLDSWNVYHFFSEMISHNLARLAVCWFFAISGYFFFRNLKDGEFNFSWVAGKWKKRVFSLLIPYLIWNLLIVGLGALKSLVFSKLGIGGHNEMPTGNLLEWLWLGPANFPLYFMRDLMIMSLVAPLWYLIVKKVKWPSLALLILVYVSPLQPAIPGMRAIFFFGVGAWLGIWRVNMLRLARMVKWPVAVVSVILLLLASYFNSSQYHEWMLRAFYPFGMLTFMNIIDKLIDKDSRRERLCNLASAVFFIYAAHEVFILGWTKGLFLRLVGDGLLGSWISYLLVPVVVILVCLILYCIFNKLTPRTLAFVSGGRAKKKI